MKKHVLAAAVLSALITPVMAQNTTLSGNIDMGMQSFDASTAVGVSDKSFFGIANGSSTSTISIVVTEDLGAGMRATFQLGNDLAAGANQGGLTGAGQSFLALSQAGVGTIRFGNINSGMLAAHLASSPMSTGLGSGNSGTFGRQSLLGVNGTYAAAQGGNAGAVGVENGQVVSTAGLASGTVYSGARVLRIQNSMALESDSINGLKFGFSASARNGDGGENTPTTGHQEFNLSYSGARVNVAAAQITFAADSAAGANTLGSNEKLKHTQVGANFALNPAITVYAGVGTSKSDVANRADSANRNIAVRFAATPALAVMLNATSVDDKLANNRDRSMTGFGVDYALSKRSTGYFRYETGDHNKSSAADGKFTNMGLGLRHSF